MLFHSRKFSQSCHNACTNPMPAGSWWGFRTQPWYRHCPASPSVSHSGWESWFLQAESKSLESKVMHGRDTVVGLEKGCGNAEMSAASTVGECDHSPCIWNNGTGLYLGWRCFVMGKMWRKGRGGEGMGVGATGLPSHPPINSPLMKTCGTVWEPVMPASSSWISSPSSEQAVWFSAMNSQI